VQEKKGEKKGKAGKIWYCRDYNRQQCDKEDGHTAWQFGEKVKVRHVCSECLRHSFYKTMNVHPATSSACPHHIQD